MQIPESITSRIKAGVKIDFIIGPWKAKFYWQMKAAEGVNQLTKLICRITKVSKYYIYMCKNMSMQCMD